MSLSTVTKYSLSIPSQVGIYSRDVPTLHDDVFTRSAEIDAIENVVVLVKDVKVLYLP